MSAHHHCWPRRTFVQGPQGGNKGTVKVLEEERLALHHKEHHIILATLALHNAALLGQEHLKDLLRQSRALVQQLLADAPLSG